MLSGSKPNASRITPTRIDSSASRKMTPIGDPPRNRLNVPGGPGRERSSGAGLSARMLMMQCLSHLAIRRSRGAVPCIDFLQYPLERFESVRLARRLVPAQPADARKAHREPRLVPRRALQALEGDFQHETALGVVDDLAHRAEALARIAANEAVDLQKLLIGEPEIRLADRDQLVAILPLGPDPEGVVGVIGGALAVTALGIHQHGVHRERLAFPLPPRSLRTSG